MPSYCGKTPCWPRGYCAMIFLIMALGLHLASVLTPMLKQKLERKMATPGVEVSYTEHTDVHLIKTWQKKDYDANDHGLVDQKVKYDSKDFVSGSCKKLSDLVQVTRAFFFCALIFCVLAIVAGLINAVAKIPSIATSVLIVITLICGLIGWAVAFAMWHKHYCTGGIAWKNVQGSKIGPAAPCLTAAWVLELLALICTCACERGNHDGLGGDDRKVHEVKPRQALANNSGPQPPKPGQVQKHQARTWHDQIDDKTWYTGEDDAQPKQPESKNSAPLSTHSSPPQKNNAEAERKRRAKAKKAERARLWKLLKMRLPSDRSGESKVERKRLFKLFDRQSAKRLTWEDADAGCRRECDLEQLVNEPEELTMITKKAFNVARGMSTADDASKEDNKYVEFREFRLFFANMKLYFELWVMFDELDESDDGKVEYTEFKNAVPKLKEFGVDIRNPEAEFREIDTAGNGVVSFHEFAQWAIAKNLDCDGESEGDELEARGNLPQ